MPRFNPPPNWPAPPPGWTPAPDWQPDPSWGPAPEGWVLWLPEPDDGRRPNRTAFARAGVVAGGVWVAVMLLQLAVGIFSATNAGGAFGSLVLPWLATSLVVFFQRRRWGWPALVGVYLAFWFPLLVITANGRTAAMA